MFILITFKILLSEDRSVLAPPSGVQREKGLKNYKMTKLVYLSLVYFCVVAELSTLFSIK